ncbi:hypothetical protein CAB17_11110 [Legionella sainthelensi]|uniref:Coiled-coil protein n=2 Tax=Legionella sainthelensi TaxID=28087 RepID=A0A2H5FLX4_9GAMM|nr:hypothetical protein CAB17_11110 [Legionella sainthelensi]
MKEKHIILMEQQACEYFALSGKEMSDRDLHTEFTELTNRLADDYTQYETILSFAEIAVVGEDEFSKESPYSLHKSENKEREEIPHLKTAISIGQKMIQIKEVKEAYLKATKEGNKLEAENKRREYFQVSKELSELLEKNPEAEKIRQKYALKEMESFARGNSIDIKKLKPLPKVGSKELRELREKNMEEIVKLQDKDLIPIDGARVFVGGICTGNQIVPEHYFVEVYYGKDDPRNMTLDTFINQRAPVIVSKAVLPGEPHHPGCEGGPSSAENVVLVEVGGLTQGQLDIITRKEREPEVIEAAKQYHLDNREDIDPKKPQFILNWDNRKNPKRLTEEEQLKIAKQLESPKVEEETELEIKIRIVKKLKDSFKDYINTLNNRGSDYSYGKVESFFSYVGLSGYSKTQKLDAIEHLINQFEDEDAEPLNATDIGALTSGSLGKLVETLLKDKELGADLKDKLNIKSGPNLSI